jgi:putative DNA primase/helicase
MARGLKRGVITADIDVDALSAEVASRFDDVPWQLFDSKDLASSGETRFLVSRIQADLLKVASVDPLRAGQIWEEHVPDFVPRPVELPEPERKDAPVNAIEPGRRRRKLQAEPYLDSVTPSASKAEDVAAPNVQNRSERPANGAEVDPVPGTRSKDAREEGRVRLLLDGLNKQYLRADDKYHFRDKAGEVAFEVQEKKLVTQHDTPSVVSSMIDLAEAQGWSSLKLTGTDEFRREAWLQASLRGLETSGHRPTKLDMARLEELRTERASPVVTNAIENTPHRSPVLAAAARFESLVDDGRAEPKIALTPTQDQFLRTMEATMRHRGDGVAAIAKARELAMERLTSDRIHVGTLGEVGTAPFQDRPGEKLSHFVTLTDDKGHPSKVWGVDLPRALNEAGAQPGQLVAVAFSGRKPVSVDVPIRDEAGKTIRTEKKVVDRNTWQVVQFDRLREEAKASVLTAVHRQQNPAELKVFDRSAQPAKPTLDLRRSRGQAPERTL